MQSSPCIATCVSLKSKVCPIASPWLPMCFVIASWEGSKSYFCKQTMTCPRVLRKLAFLYWSAKF